MTCTGKQQQKHKSQALWFLFHKSLFLWVSDILHINLQLLLLFFLVAEEEEGWMIFDVWQLLQQSSPARTFSLWCNTQLESAGEESCSSHSCVYTKSPWKTVISQQTTSTATFKSKEQIIYYKDRKEMVHMYFTTGEGCRHEEEAYYCSA